VMRLVIKGQIQQTICVDICFWAL